MYVGSLFSGIGGIELGFERQGFTTRWFVEKDKYAQTILKKQFPETHIYEDITQVDFRAVPKVEILTGGFPCQDISNAGKREGIEGERSSLWQEYKRAIMQIRPRFAFIENVSALTHRGLDTVLCDLAEIGYDAEWYCVRASDVGALHRRERIFILSYPNNSRCMDRQAEEQSTEIRKHAQCESESGSSDVENSISDRLRKRRTQDSSSDDSKWGDTQRERTSKTVNFSDASTYVSDTMQSELERSRTKREQKSRSCEEEEELMQCIGYWSTEPRVGRVADGVPFRVDRIRCLGNAVVPQVAEIFAEAIKMKCMYPNDSCYDCPNKDECMDKREE